MHFQTRVQYLMFVTLIKHKVICSAAIEYTINVKSNLKEAHTNRIKTI